MIKVEYLITCDYCGKKISKDSFQQRKGEVLQEPQKIFSCLSSLDLCTGCEEKARKAIDKAFKNQLRQA